jgi:ribosomal protein L11 methyltransferase
MSLWEVKADLPVEHVDQVDDMLLEREDERWSVMHDVLIPAAWVVGLFTDEAEARQQWSLIRTLVPEAGEATISEMADADWQESYKLHFQAWHCGRLHWVPVWERESHRMKDGDVAVWLDPGMAFGTGNHETTRLCCERLVAWAETAPQDARIIDAGCGSGILALSAARLGFTDIRGFDNDPEAVRISGENATLNDVADTISFYEGDLSTGWADGPADLVLANILGHILAEHVPQLTAAVKPGGLLVLSGILAVEVRTIQAAFTRAVPDWQVETREMGEWCDIALRRP